jgi:hypothetical protein
MSSVDSDSSDIDPAHNLLFQEHISMLLRTSDISNRSIKEKLERDRERESFLAAKNLL